MVYTTGQIAKMCSVAPRTVTKWIDKGVLKGYRLPLSKDRRVSHEDLYAFMRSNGLEHLMPKMKHPMLVIGEVINRLDVVTRETVTNALQAEGYPVLKELDAIDFDKL